MCSLHASQVFQDTEKKNKIAMAVTSAGHQNNSCCMGPYSRSSASRSSLCMWLKVDNCILHIFPCQALIQKCTRNRVARQQTASILLRANTTAAATSVPVEVEHV